MTASIDYLEEKLASENPLDDNEINKTQLGDESNIDDLNGVQGGETENEEGRVTARLNSIIIFHLFYRHLFRPRRLSELNIVEKVKPIPPYSSLFVFKHTNQFVDNLFNHLQLKSFSQF